MIIPGLFSTGKFGIVPDPPEYDECLGYWDNPDKFSEYGCKTCANYDECLRASEEDNVDLGDYPDTIHNQFDNMTGSMNL